MPVRFRALDVFSPIALTFSFSLKYCVCVCVCGGGGGGGGGGGVKEKGVRGEEVKEKGVRGEEVKEKGVCSLATTCSKSSSKRCMIDSLDLCPCT